MSMIGAASLPRKLTYAWGRSNEPLSIMLAFFSVFLSAFVLTLPASREAPMVYRVARSELSTSRQSTRLRDASFRAFASSNACFRDWESP